jgi:PAS domain-containing protein
LISRWRCKVGRIPTGCRAPLPEETTENDRKVLINDGAMRMVEALPAAAGRMTEWLVLKFPMRTANGRKLIGGVGIDITKQQAAERALREREAQFRDLFDDAPCSVPRVG